MLPNATRVNRGGQVVAELVASARAHDFSDVLVLHEHRGQPDGLVVCHLPYGPTAYFGVHNAVCGGGRGAGGGWGQGLQGLAARAGGRGRARGGTPRAPTHTPTSHTPPRAHPRPPTHSFPPQVLRHDLGDKKQVGTLSEACPHLVLDNFTSALGARVATILKHLFPPPKPDAKRVVTFANRADYISFRHHTHAAPRGPASATLTEVGPRFELKLYQASEGDGWRAGRGGRVGG